MSSFPKLLDSQTAVAYAEYTTGIILASDGSRKLDSSLPAYHIFSSEQEAVETARSFLRRHGLDGEADGEVGGTPDDVDQAEREGDLGVSGGKSGGS